MTLLPTGRRTPRGDAGGEPDELSYVGRGMFSTTRYTFPVVRLTRWATRWSELEALAPGNPFAVIVMAQLLADRHRDGRQRLAHKIRLVRLLFEHGYRREDVLELYNLIDWMIALPAGLDAQFGQAVEQIDKEYGMAFVSTIERLGIKKGLKQGMQQGMQKGIQQGMQQGMQKGMQQGIQRGQQQGMLTLLQRQLVRKFGPLPAWAQARLARASEAALIDWSDRLLDASRLEDVLGSAAEE